MKRIFTVLAVAAMTLALVSCTSRLEKKARYYVEEAAEASARGDWDRVEELIEEEQEFIETLSYEEQVEYQQYVYEAAADLLD